MFVSFRKTVPGGILPRAPSSARHLNAHHILQYALEAAEHGQLVDLLRHLLQRLELLQAQERRVLIHDSRGVEQRTRRRRLLATLDEVRLGDLLRLHHLVEDGLHLTRQDDVLHTHRTHRQAVLCELRRHGRTDLAIERALVAEQLIERAATHGLAQRELELLVRELHEVLERAARLHGIEHLPRGREVHAQADLVAGQDFLARDLHALHAVVDQLGLERALELPERVQTGAEHLRELTIDDQQCDRRIRHFHRAHAIRELRGERLLGASQKLRERRRNLELLRDVVLRDAHLDRATPVELTRTRAEHARDLAVLVDHANLAFADLHDIEVLRHHGRRILTDEIDTR